jgi:hypothetical protein
LVPALECELKRAEERKQFKELENDKRSILETALDNFSITLKNNRLVTGEDEHA